MGVGTLSTSGASRPRYSVLVVDDERDVRDQLRLRYEMEGYRVFDADGGDAALALCRTVRPDLVVTDIRMARGTGTELLKKLNADAPSVAMPIVLCITGYADLRTHDAFDFGACAVFRKPFDMKDLMAASRRFLELREAETRAAVTMGQFEKDLRTLVDVTLRSGRSDNAQAPKLEDLREVTAMVLHEINRPLSVIAMNSSLLVGALKEDPPRVPAAVKMATNVESSCQKLVQISRSMRELFMRGRTGSDQVVLASDLVRGSISAVDEAGKLKGVELTVKSGDRPCFVSGSTQQLHQALVNLIENAAEASRAGTKAQVEVTIETSEDHVRIAVIDSGTGVPAEIRERIFEPFFTTKGEKGTGMGLSIAMKVASAHRGSLTLSEANGRTKFELQLPRVKK